METPSQATTPYKGRTQRKQAHRSSLASQDKLYSEQLMNYEIVNVPRDKFTTILVKEMYDYTNRRVYTINPHSYCISKVDRKFRESLEDAEFIVPDGTGIVLASIIMGQTITKRITGTDVFMELCTKLNAQNKGKVGFFGSSTNTLKLMEERFTRDFPRVEITTMISPPYRELTEEENNQFCQEINNSGTEVLFVSMTAPKQEKWIYNNMHRLDVRIIVPIGAAFDFYAGTVERPKLFWRRIGMEWLPRFFKEPHRLWKRNFISTPTFLTLLLKAKFKQKFIKKKRSK